MLLVASSVTRRRLGCEKLRGAIAGASSQCADAGALERSANSRATPALSTVKILADVLHVTNIRWPQLPPVSIVTPGMSLSLQGPLAKLNQLPSRSIA